MFSLLFGLLFLGLGYVLYGRLVERAFGADPSRATPATTMTDGVDYVPLRKWRLFMIQFLNIAGLGPIFGPILGAMYGPAAFLWIVLGGVFGGAVHDYCCGMLSARQNGASVPELIGAQLGPVARQGSRGFTIILLLLIGVVFSLGPAQLLEGLSGIPKAYWLVAIFGYYILATLLPIDKIIGKIYPFFGFLLFFMAVAILSVMLLKHGAAIPEITWSSMANKHLDPEKFPLFPMLFITIACGAVSGFHSTQSPLVSRCLRNERDGRVVFYGGMLAESVVALIWAAAAMTFFGGATGLNINMGAHSNNAAWLVNEVCHSWLGRFGGALAIMGVIICPITSGDTAFRSSRLIIADILKLPQRPIKNRLFIVVPLFGLAFYIATLRFDVVWRYFSWANQTLAAAVLWTAAVWLARKRRPCWLAAIPAIAMTDVSVSYILGAPEGFRLPWDFSIGVGTAAAAAAATWFILWLWLGKTGRLCSVKQPSLP